MCAATELRRWRAVRPAHAALLHRAAAAAPAATNVAAVARGGWFAVA